MSKLVTCFDVVSMVVEEATNQFSPVWKLDNEKFKILGQYCDVIDSLAKEFDGESYDVEINDISMDIIIVVECPDIVIENHQHKYYELISRAKSFGFSVTESGNLSVRFVFPGIWNRVI